MKPRALVVLSGGQDSTTCLFWALERGFDPWTLTINYGQRHALELQAADRVAYLAGVPHAQRETLELGPVLRSTSPLVSNSELEQYKDHESLPGGIEKTFVPLRNQLFLTLAANRAVSVGADTLITGVCQEDFGGYPDCRQVFIDALQRTINLSNEGAARPIEIMTPLMNMTKAQSVLMAVSMPGCYGALAYSHTSYDGHYPPNGRDHATLLRAKGFIEADVPDPLILRAHFRDNVMSLPDTHNYRPQRVDEYLPMIPRRFNF